jgi:hypothetical protein
MNVRIVKRPLGEAPEDIRDAWIGLSLPVLPRYSRIVERRAIGVISGPKSLLGIWWRQLFGSEPRWQAYMVSAETAVNRLADANPSAAAWWRVNTPHLLKPGGCLVFDKDCCVAEDSGKDEVSSHLPVR